MDREVLSYINYLEGCKTAIKSLHWDPDNMSQHKLDDEIADAIADFQDQVAEVEQGIHGQLPLNQLKGDTITVKDLESFVEDVISKTTDFYKQLDGKGDEYIGMRSDCESFLSAMQKNLYLLRFTIKNAMKEEMKRRIKANLREAMYKNVNNHDTVDKFMGRRPVSAKSRINQIYRIVKKYGLDGRKYTDENWQAVDDYKRVIESLGCQMEIWVENGGYTDYADDGMPRSKEYKCQIRYDDGMVLDGYMKMMAAGTIADPFSSYDTMIMLWPKSKRELAAEGKQEIIKNAVNEAIQRFVQKVTRNPNNRKR